MNYRYEVRVTNDPEWYGNAVVFPTDTEARAAASSKAWSWTAVESTRVLETDAPANYHFIDGTLHPIHRTES